MRIPSRKKTVLCGITFLATVVMVGLLLRTSTTAPFSRHPIEMFQQAYASVKISPATSNKNLKFEGDFTQLFQTTSMRKAFQEHPAFEAVYSKNSFGESSGQIVALSDEFASRENSVFALTGARKGLITTIMTAYSQHCNLVIGPDDVWLTILAQFSAYVNRNAESLRGRIVEHEGKNELEVYSDGTLSAADYEGMIKDMLAQIRENIKSPDLADWFRPGFSTTTERDEVCAAATAMGSLQAYFEYKFSLLCGIPAVTLMGTIADWNLLREKIEHLLEFEVENNADGNVMELWVGYLRKVCDGFVESAEHPGSVKTLDFWDKVLSHKSYGSGSSYITGWVSAFTCFDRNGTFIGRKREVEEMGKTVITEFPLIDSADICDNIVSVPVKIDDNGVEYDGTLFTGQVVFEAEQDKTDAYPTVRPRNDWCMTVVANK